MEINIDKTQNSMSQNEKKEIYTYNIVHIWKLGTIVRMDDGTCNCLIKYSVEWYPFKFSRSNKVYVEVALITYMHDNEC